jgi:hypothetical protein
LVHDEECKLATDALDPQIEPRPHAGVLFEAGAIQNRRQPMIQTRQQSAGQAGLFRRFGVLNCSPLSCHSGIGDHLPFAHGLVCKILISAGCVT